LRGVTQGVNYLHSLQPPVIHGDLHPGNVLLDAADKPILCDFGLSRIIHEVTRTRTLRQAGGYVRFLAPELARSPEDRFRTTWASDIYSLSMLSLNMWTGNRPFYKHELEWKVFAALEKGERPEKPTDPLIHTNLPQGFEIPFWKLLREMWAEDMVIRPTSGVVMERLDKIFAGEAPHDAGIVATVYGQIARLGVFLGAGQRPRPNLELSLRA
ncbi:kinase-like protein, partial [Clavulina sp. PMI_390]